MIRAIVIASILLSLAGAAWTSEAGPFRFGAGGDKPIDRAKIVERLRSKYQDVLDQFNKNGSGADTLAMQKEIAELLKRLLDQDDPPPSSAPSAPPMKQPKREPSISPPQVKRPPLADTPSAKRGEAESSPKSLAESAAKRGETESSPKSLAEMKKELQAKGHWPLKLPPRHRDNVDVSANGRFMPRYEELLRAYYRTIAESGRGQREE